MENEDMVSCEKCWRDARENSDKYRKLLAERNKTGKCTPEEQAGLEATVCQKCGRKAVHQHCYVCMACGKQE